MTTDIALTLVIILVAIILFATEKLRVDLVALLVLIAVSVTGLVSKEEVFLGFANPAVITIWAVYIVSGGLFKTGVADALGSLILRLSGASEPRLIFVIMLICGIMSSFMNNVGAVAVLMPAVIGIARKTNIPVSKLLIPLAFSSLLGGKMTLIGTPANILAQGILVARGLEGFGFFEITPMGAVVLGTGIIYMVFFGRHLLPVRQKPDDSPETMNLRDYISQVQVPAESPLVGKNIYESKLGSEYDLILISIIRGGETISRFHRDLVIEVNDCLVVEGSPQSLLAAQEALNLVVQVERDIKLSELDTGQSHIYEATLAPRSTMVGRTLNEVSFRDQFGFSALAIWRQGGIITQNLRDMKLYFGDKLLLIGTPGRLQMLQKGDEFLVLEPIEVQRRRRHKAPLAVGIMLLVIVSVLGALSVLTVVQRIHHVYRLTRVVAADKPASKTMQALVDAEERQNS